MDENRGCYYLKYIDKDIIDKVKDKEEYRDAFLCVKRKWILQELMNQNRAKGSRKHSWICCLTILACVIVLSYILTADLPEIVLGIEKWYNLLFQFSIAYITSAIFYVITVWMPRKVSNNRLQVVVHLRVGEIIDNMESILETILKSSVNDSTKHLLNEENVQMIRKVDFGKQSDVNDIQYLASSESHRLMMSVYLKREIYDTKNNISELITFYHDELSLELICLLEEILHTYLMDNDFDILLDCKSEVEFDQEDNVFNIFFELIQKLKNLKENNFLNQS